MSHRRKFQPPESMHSMSKVNTVCLLVSNRYRLKESHRSDTRNSDPLSETNSCVYPNVRLLRSRGSFQCRSQWCFRNETMSHVDTHPLLVHPPLSRVRVSFQVNRELFTKRRRLVSTLICPQLITVPMLIYSKNH